MISSSSSLLLLLTTVSVTYAACPENWIEYGGTGKCFTFDNKNKVSYKQAIAYCEEQGAQLVSVCSFFENQFVRGITRGVATWLEPKPECDYKNYLEGKEPTSVKSCRVITDDWDGQWTSADCETEKHYTMCSKPNPKSELEFVASAPSFPSRRFLRFRRRF